jgi:hypothetical protein
MEGLRLNLRNPKNTLTTMSWIFVDKDKEGSQSQMRSEMRRNMRSGYYRHDGDMYMRGGYRDDYNSGYRMGYKHGYEDSWDDSDDEMYRRSRDSRGRYM